MKIIREYKGVNYPYTQALRDKIFEDTGLIFGHEPETTEARIRFWAELGVTYKEVPPTDDELAIRARYERDAKLRATDKYLLPDFPGVTPEALEAVKVYREALRNVPEQVGFPRQITWPEVPVFMKAKEKRNV